MALISPTVGRENSSVTSEPDCLVRFLLLVSGLVCSKNVRGCQEEMGCFCMKKLSCVFTGNQSWQCTMLLVSLYRSGLSRFNGFPFQVGMLVEVFFLAESAKNSNCLIFESTLWARCIFRSFRI